MGPARSPRTGGKLLAACLVAATLAAGCIGGSGTTGDDATSAVETLQVYAIAQVSGDAHAGLPVVPLNATDDGALVGEPVWRQRFGGAVGTPHDALAWHGYCGREDSPALDPDHTDDNRLYYASLQTHASDREPWYADRVGEPIRAEDLPEGEPVYAFWRSQGLEAGDQLVIALVRLNASRLSPLAQQFAHDGVVAFSASSTNFCTVVKMAGAADRAYSAAWAPGIEDDPRLFVDAVHNGAWNPRWVIRDTLPVSPTEL